MKRKGGDEPGCDLRFQVGNVIVQSSSAAAPRVLARQVEEVVLDTLLIEHTLLDQLE
jgi:hypothetical protein